MKLEISTPIKINENYVGLLAGLSKYFAIKATTITKIVFEIADTSEAPACIKLA